MSGCVEADLLREPWEYTEVGILRVFFLLGKWSFAVALAASSVRSGPVLSSTGSEVDWLKSRGASLASRSIASPAVGPTGLGIQSRTRRHAFSLIALD